MTKVMRITNSLGFGGIEKVFELHGKYFDKGKYELVFVALNQGGNTADTLMRMGYRVIILSSSVKIPSTECILKLRALFRNEKPDVIHTCGAEANFHGIIAGRLCGVPTIIAEEIGLPNHSRIARIIYRILYLFTYKVIAISDSVRGYLRTYEASDDKVVRIYNPVEIEPSTVKSKELQERIIFSSLCRLAPIKNCQMIINLVASLRMRHPNKEFLLWLIGDGPERPALEKLAADNNLGTNVVFWGYRDNPKELLKGSDIFVLASLKEGFGLACVEAIQVGLPVIVSNSGGMPEFITDGENGFLFDPHSFDELLLKTEQMLSLSNEERFEMTRRARITVDGNFSPHVYLKELEDLYLRM